MRAPSRALGDAGAPARDLDLSLVKPHVATSRDEERAGVGTPNDRLTAGSQEQQEDKDMRDKQGRDDRGRNEERLPSVMVSPKELYIPRIL